MFGLHAEIKDTTAHSWYKLCRERVLVGLISQCRVILSVPHTRTAR